jgi:hypothetical protein
MAEMIYASHSPGVRVWIVRSLLPGVQCGPLRQEFGIMFFENHGKIGVIAGVQSLDELMNLRRHHEQAAGELGRCVPVGVRRVSRHE